jgi:hypothetical protein
MPPVCDDGRGSGHRFQLLDTDSRPGSDEETVIDIVGR